MSTIETVIILQSYKANMWYSSTTCWQSIDSGEQKNSQNALFCQQMVLPDLEHLHNIMQTTMLQNDSLTFWKKYDFFVIFTNSFWTNQCYWHNHEMYQ